MRSDLHLSDHREPLKASGQRRDVVRSEFQQDLSRAVRWMHWRRETGGGEAREEAVMKV